MRRTDAAHGPDMEPRNRQTLFRGVAVLGHRFGTVLRHGGACRRGGRSSRLRVRDRRECERRGEDCSGKDVDRVHDNGFLDKTWWLSSIDLAADLRSVSENRSGEHAARVTVWRTAAPGKPRGALVRARRTLSASAGLIAPNARKRSGSVAKGHHSKRHFTLTDQRRCRDRSDCRHRQKGQPVVESIVERRFQRRDRNGGLV